MFPLTIDLSVARATGESLRTIRRHGFSFSRQHQSDPAYQDIQLVVDCPFCRRPVIYPAVVDRGETLLAECSICDIEFDFDLDEVYVLEASSSSAPTLRRQAC